jgi:hypothetical protein
MCAVHTGRKVSEDPQRLEQSYVDLAACQIRKSGGREALYIYTCDFVRYQVCQLYLA